MAFLALFRDQYARGARLLMDDRGQLAQKQLARGDGLGQTQRQELRGRGRLDVLLLGRVALKLLDLLLGAPQVEHGPEFGEGVDGQPQMLPRALGLRGGGVGAAQEVVRARRAVAVAEHLRDGEAAAEVMDGERRVLPCEGQKTLNTLHLARDSEISRRRLGLLREAR